MGKDAPDPPDFQAAAEAQAASSREVTEQQTWANRPTVNTPFGQQTWEVTPVWDPATGQYINTWEQNTNLTPELQSAVDAQQRIQEGRSGLAESLLGRAETEFGQPMDWNQFVQLGGVPQPMQFGATPNVPNYTPEQIQRGIDTQGLQEIDPSMGYFNRAEDAIFGQWANRMEPRFEQQAEQTRTKLYNQGLREGDEAFDREMQRVRQDQQDARTQAQFGATSGAGEEASRLFGMDLSTRGQQFGERESGGAFANQAAAQAMQQQLGIGGQRFGQDVTRAGIEDTRGQVGFGQQLTAANYQNQLRQQQISEELQRRGFSLNEINAILTGQQVAMPSMPGFNAAQRSEAVQYNQAAQNQGQAELDAFNAEQQAMQGMMQGAGSMAMMFCDRRLKKNIVEWTYDAVRGLQTYFFNYIWEKDTDPGHYGYMADEVEKLYPDAVVNFNGYKMVTIWPT